jgi:hypothetical protein
MNLLEISCLKESGFVEALMCRSVQSLFPWRSNHKLLFSSSQHFFFFLIGFGPAKTVQYLSSIANIYII